MVDITIMWPAEIAKEEIKKVTGMHGKPAEIVEKLREFGLVPFTHVEGGNERFYTNQVLESHRKYVQYRQIIWLSQNEVEASFDVAPMGDVSNLIKD